MSIELYRSYLTLEWSTTYEWRSQEETEKCAPLNIIGRACDSYGKNKAYASEILYTRFNNRGIWFYENLDDAQNDTNFVCARWIEYDQEYQRWHQYHQTTQYVYFTGGTDISNESFVSFVDNHMSKYSYSRVFVIFNSPKTNSYETTSQPSGMSFDAKMCYQGSSFSNNTKLDITSEEKKIYWDNDVWVSSNSDYVHISYPNIGTQSPIAGFEIQGTDVTDTRLVNALYDYFDVSNITSSDDLQYRTTTIDDQQIVAKFAINDQYGNNIADTYTKKSDIDICPGYYIE